MNDTKSTLRLLEKAADAVRQFDPIPHSNGLASDRWVASSLLQKAVRRGHIADALNAASRILADDYQILWRRLNVIAWEDITFGDIELCCMVTVVSRSKIWRSKIGGEWAAASYLIERMCKAQKNRVTDDLLTIIENDPIHTDTISKLAHADSQQLGQIIYPQDRKILHRVIAAWYAVGTDKFPHDLLPRRSGDVAVFFDGFTEDEAPQELLPVFQYAMTKTRTIFPALVALLWSEWMETEKPAEVMSDDLSGDYLITDIPRYAFDGHTRAGRRYLGWLAKQDDELAWFLHSSAPKSIHGPLLRKLSFRTSASLCANRQIWKTTEKARGYADQVGFELPAETINQGKAIFIQASLNHPMTEAHL